MILFQRWINVSSSLNWNVMAQSASSFRLFPEFSSPGFILNHLLSLHSAVKSNKLLRVVCLELYEPQVVLSALSGGSPLPQGVQWHQHPQWLLSAHQHSVAAATLTLEAILRCASLHSFSSSWGSKIRDVVIGGTKGQDEGFALSRKASLPSILISSSLFFVLRWRSVCWFSGSWSMSSVFHHILHILRSRNSIQVFLLNDKIHVHHAQ